MDRKNEIWARLKKKMSNKRTAKKGIASSNGTVPPREIVVQRLSSEPDNKQTYKPVQPREFVSFDYPEITVKTLKSACSHHFNLPAKNCDVLVSNKGPSCTNINQIPMRKDKVYLVRFVIDSENEDSANYSRHRVTSTVSASSSQQYNFLNDSISSPPSKKRSVKSTESENGFDKPSYPVSVSVESILNAGKLIQPVKKSKCVLDFESFNIHDKVWKIEMSGEVLIEQESFASGGFREAYMVEKIKDHSKWVLKKFNQATVKTILETLDSSLEDITRKQVQMHTAASQITKAFNSKISQEFGESFTYNNVYFCKINTTPYTIEEYVDGQFKKWINNNGVIVPLSDMATIKDKEIFLKAQCFVHYTYEKFDKKLMVLDIQGSGYTLFDPEICTTELIDTDSNQIMFCCGNLSITGIETFLCEHRCNKYCQIMIDKEKLISAEDSSSEYE